MNVKLLRVTEKGINLVAEAARISGVSSIQTAKGIIELITDNDYSSALEHIYFTFDISEISVALSRELLEHRIASHTARSTRYV
jgi:thymidylate synthase ThyX